MRGIRVLDLTAVWAGPFATLLLADLGAEVICIESLQYFVRSVRGWIMRPTKEAVAKMGVFAGAYVDKDPGPRPWNRHANFNSLGRNKLSMTVDLKRPEGQEIFFRLVALSDVVVSNYATGTMDKLGIGYAVLKKVNPGMIVINMPSFGNTGPYREYRATGNHVEAFSGFTSLRGYRNMDVSTNSMTFHMDAATGPGAVFGILSALIQRRKTGHGQFIDLSQQENMLPHLGEYLMDYQMNHRIHGPIGNRDFFGSVQGCYPCRGDDQWIVLTLRHDGDWQGLVRAANTPAWVRDPRFATTLSRLQHQDALDQAIATWTCNLAPAEAMQLLQQEGVPAGPVLDERAAYADPHLQARGFFVRLTHKEAGTHDYPRYVWKYHNESQPEVHPPPCLGENNEYVYRHLLGVSGAEFERLVNERHIGEEYVSGNR